MDDERYNWQRLTHLQIGRYAEYFIKMEFTLWGFDVYNSEVDDKGIDFVIRKNGQQYYDVQVKSIRKLSYIFFPKSKFELQNNLFAAVVIFLNGQAPLAYLIPSLIWQQPNALFVVHDYEGENYKSKPEWGLNLSYRNLPLLEPYAFSRIVKNI